MSARIFKILVSEVQWEAVLKFTPLPFDSKGVLWLNEELITNFIMDSKM